MSSEMEGGSSKGAHIRSLQASAERYGITLSEEDLDDGPDPGEPPPGFEFIWEVFRDLSAARAYGFGPCPISYHDIVAWSRLNRTRLRVWEVDLLRRTDSIWISVVNEREKDKVKSQETPTPESPK
jgi:hypothetical protein